MPSARHDIVLRFGKRPRQLRMERALSQAALAERVGVTPEYVSRIERGEGGPSMEVVDRLARALAVEVEELFAFHARKNGTDPALLRLLDVARSGSSEQRQLILRLAETVVRHRRRR